MCSTRRFAKTLDEYSCLAQSSVQRGRRLRPQQLVSGSSSCCVLSASGDTRNVDGHNDNLSQRQPFTPTPFTPIPFTPIPFTPTPFHNVPLDGVGGTCTNPVKCR